MIKTTKLSCVQLAIRRDTCTMVANEGSYMNLVPQLIAAGCSPRILLNFAGWVRPRFFKSCTKEAVCMLLMKEAVCIFLKPEFVLGQHVSHGAKPARCCARQSGQAHYGAVIVPLFFIAIFSPDNSDVFPHGRQTLGVTLFAMSVRPVHRVEH